MSDPPYDDLYIYMLDGIVPEPEESGLGNGFIGNWVEGENSFLFFTTPAEERVFVLLKQLPGVRLLDDFYFHYEEWQGGGLDPLRVGPFLIVPPWVERQPSKDEIGLLIDPGVVFGTGLHPTTRDCLKAMACLNETASMGRVLDIGTGTGILALAAAAIGAEKVCGIDSNPLCVKTARRNVSLNHLDHAVSIEKGTAEEFSGKPAETVFANIHFDAIRQLMEEPCFRKREWFIFSGLMRSQARDLKVLIGRYGLQVVDQWDSEMTWHTMLVSSR